MVDVSVIVPVYNVEKFLRPSVKSMLGQTHKNIEIILVDDGCSDRSAEICDEFAASDERVKVIHQENGGVGSARNCGIDAASGEYLYFCDSDDIITPNLVEDNYRLAKDNDADIVMFGIKIEWKRENGAKRDRARVDLPPLQGVYDRRAFWENFRKSYILRGIVVNSLFRRDLINSGGIRFSDMRNGEDTYFLFDIYSLPFNKIVYNPKVYYIQQKRSGSATGIFQPLRAEQEYALSRRFDDFLSNSPFAAGRYNDMAAKYYVAGLYKTLENIARAGKSMSIKEKTAALRDYLGRDKVRQSLKNVTLNVYDTRGSKLKVLILKALIGMNMPRAAIFMAQLHIKMNS